MRTALRPNPTRALTSQTQSIPSPIGGWNARNSIAAMPPMDAVVMDNFFPDTDYVKLRSGYINFT